MCKLRCFDKPGEFLAGGGAQFLGWILVEDVLVGLRALALSLSRTLLSARFHPDEGVVEGDGDGFFEHGLAGLTILTTTLTFITGSLPTVGCWVVLTSGIGPAFGA